MIRSRIEDASDHLQFDCEDFDFKVLNIAQDIEPIHSRLVDCEEDQFLKPYDRTRLFE